MAKSKRFEGVKELIGLVVVLGTGATLSMAWEAYGGARAPLRVVAREAGDVWVGSSTENYVMTAAGTLPAGGFGDYEGKVGVTEVTLRRGDKVIAKTYAVLKKGTHPEVVLGITETVDPQSKAALRTVEAGGATWLAGDVGGANRWTWDEAMRACPAGFTLPSALQWQQLAAQFGGCDGCDAVESVDVGTAGIALISDSDVAIRLSGNSRYWTSTETAAGSAATIATTYDAGGSGMRDKNQYERRDAKLLEKARGTPGTLNERRKSQARVNEKVAYTYGASASLSLGDAEKNAGAYVRCVRR